MQNKTISKTDYMRYLECPLYGWLAKHKPELMDGGETMAMRQGKEVEKVAHGLFKKGVEVKSYYEAGSKETMKLVKKGTPVIYQAQAMTDLFLARTDILMKKKDGWHLYEVKSSTKVKTKYIHDLKFQANAFKLAGVELKSVNLIYINNQYIFDKKKGLDIKELFIIEDLTNEIFEGLDEELKEMKKSHKILTGNKKPVLVSLKKKFEYDLAPLMAKEYYKGVPDFSIYEISGSVGRDKLDELCSKEILKMKDIPTGFDLTEKQWRQVNLTKKKGKDVVKRAIKADLDKLEFPLYFLDYETVQPAVPKFNKTRPWQQIPMQYSLHVMEKPGGKVKHYEYLHDKKTSPFEPIAKSLRANIGDKGTVIAWSAGFEKMCNKEVMKGAPKYRDFLLNVNHRMYDIMNIFKDRYVDYRFKGRTSLKIVLPVLVPKLSYEDLGIQGGMEASNAIYNLVFGEVKNKKKLEKWLLEYCDRDTLAMVRIYELLVAL